MVKRAGRSEQKKTKRGVLVFRKASQDDRTQPLPETVCEACKRPIKIGTPYKHVTPKTTAFGGASAAATSPARRGSRGTSPTP